MKNKIKLTKEKVIGIILSFILCCCLIYIGFWFYQTSLNKKRMKELENEVLVENNVGEINIEDDEETKRLVAERAKIDFDKLYEINKDIKGWLKIEALGISYPIAQYTDNQYYLKKDIYKQNSISGSIYLDYRNNGFEDINTVIYGHNMKNDTMFGKLDEILKGKVRNRC